MACSVAERGRAGEAVHAPLMRWFQWSLIWQTMLTSLKLDAAILHFLVEVFPPNAAKKKRQEKAYSHWTTPGCSTSDLPSLRANLHLADTT